MKVLLISPGIPPPSGGLQRATERLAVAMATLADVHVIAQTSDTTRPRTFSTNLVRIGSGRGRFYADVRFVCRVLYETLRRRPDVVHAMTWRAGVALALVPRRVRPPLVVHAHGSEILLVPRKVHWVRDLVFRRAAAVIAVSAFTSELVKRVTGADALVVGNGVDAPVLPERVESPDALRVLSVSRLVARKGFDRVITACERARAQGAPIALRIVGEGPEATAIRTRISDLDWARADGWISDGDLEQAYARADVFLLLPRVLPDDVEGFGIVFLEAAAHAIPVVATGVGGVPEVVRSGASGYVVADEDEAARALIELWRDLNLRVRMGAAARAVAEASSWDNRAADVIAVYRSVQPSTSA
jgi:phosphatidylinositol alpha-1,6-mannosyltransferase